MLQSSLIEQINLIVKKHIEKHKVVGWVLGIKRYEQVRVFLCGGYADWTYSIPMTVNKVFKIGSVTKLITSILILQLVEQKKISFNESIRKYLCGLPIQFDTVTILGLLNHTAGLKDYIDKN